jgi:hypothetical protein
MTPIEQDIAEDAFRPGWCRLPQEALPTPTYWPVVLAVGILGVAWGLVTSVLLLGVGLVLVACACAGWIRDLRNADR